MCDIPNIWSAFVVIPSRNSVEPVEFIELFKTKEEGRENKNLSFFYSGLMITNPICTCPEKELDFLLLFAICYYMVKW